MPDVTSLHEIDLRALAEMTSAERAFLSFYGSGLEGRRAVDGRVARIRRLLAGHDVELEHFERSLERLQQWLDENPPSSSGTVAFACAALDFVTGWHVPVEVPTVLRVGASPYLRPLAELQDEFGTLGIVAADNRAAQIHVVTVDGASRAASVRGDVKNAVKKGGWSQKRYSRRRDKQFERYATDVAQVLSDLDAERRFDRIVLLGSDESLREIGDQLPEALRDRVVSQKAFDLKQSDESLVDEGWRQWFAEERSREGQLWDEIREAAFGHGQAVLGPTDVLDALREGRASQLLLARDAGIPGTSCRSCQHVVHGTPQTCQSCGAADVFQIDLVDEFVRLAELTSCDVEFADPIPALTAEGGTGALLRY